MIKFTIEHTAENGDKKGVDASVERFDKLADALKISAQVLFDAVHPDLFERKMEALRAGEFAAYEALAAGKPFADR